MPAGKGRAEHARLEDFKAQEVSNVTHAFAKLGIYNTDVLEVMSSRHLATNGQCHDTWGMGSDM